MANTLEQLIEREVRKVLREASYTEADIPKFFWLITDINPEHPEQAKQIVDGELHGVEGISDTKRIIVDWLGVARNTVLIMPGKPFVEINNVTRIMYENPHYLASKTLKAVFRLVNRSQKRDSDWSGLMKTLIGYIFASRDEVQLSRDLSMILSEINRGTLSSVWFGKIFQETKPTLNSIKDIAAWLKQTSIQVASERAESLVKYAKSAEVGEWEQLVTEALAGIGRVYQKEGEWLIKDDSLTIPPGSTVLVALDTMPEEISDKAKEVHKNPETRPKIMMGRLRSEIQQLEFIDYVRSLNLDSRYNFSFISNKKFQAYRKRLWGDQ